jgi:hypothetical protein
MDSQREFRLRPADSDTRRRGARGSTARHTRLCILLGRVPRAAWRGQPRRP